MEVMSSVSGSPIQQGRPYAPRNDNQRVGVIAPQEQQIVVGQPRLELHKALAGFPRLDLGRQSRAWRNVRCGPPRGLADPLRGGAVGVGADQSHRHQFDTPLSLQRRALESLGFFFAWCCVEWPVLTQRESLVSQAHAGLGGAGGGLTYGADRCSF